MPDIEKLRRFALMAALLLFSFSVAGIELIEGAKISPLGVPIQITRPELLPLGLMVLSAYALLRYYYYAMMLSSSPYRRRQKLLKSLRPVGTLYPSLSYVGSVYFVPRDFEAIVLFNNPETARAELDKFIESFPKVWRSELEGKFKSIDVMDDDQKEHRVVELRVSIPAACRFAALLQDVDYSAPVWMNLVALAMASAAFR